MHLVESACPLPRPSAGNNIPARIAMIAMTTSNSIRVNPRFFETNSVIILQQVPNMCDVRRPAFFYFFHTTMVGPLVTAAEMSAAPAKFRLRESRWRNRRAFNAARKRILKRNKLLKSAFLILKFNNALKHPKIELRFDLRCVLFLLGLLPAFDEVTKTAGIFAVESFRNSD